MHKLWLPSSYIYICWVIHTPKVTVMFSPRIVTQESQIWNVGPQKWSLEININWVTRLSQAHCVPTAQQHHDSIRGSGSPVPAISYLSPLHLHLRAPGSPWPALVLGQGITPSLFKEGEMCLCLKSMHSARRSTSCLSYCYNCSLFWVIGGEGFSHEWAS